jgi:hypothetical protein
LSKSIEKGSQVLWGFWRRTDFNSTNLGVLLITDQVDGQETVVHNNIFGIRNVGLVSTSSLLVNVKIEYHQNRFNIDIKETRYFCKGIIVYLGEMKVNIVLNSI